MIMPGYCAYLYTPYDIQVYNGGLNNMTNTQRMKNDLGTLDRREMSDKATEEHRFKNDELTRERREKADTKTDDDRERNDKTTIVRRETKDASPNLGLALLLLLVVVLISGTLYVFT